MSESRTTPPGDDDVRMPDPAQVSPGPDAAETRTPSRKPQDPLRGSATSGIWLAVVGFAVLLVLLAIFILQNTGSTQISFLGWTGSAPLAAMLLIASAAGALLVVMAGSLRILQLRRRVRQDRRRSKA